MAKLTAKNYHTHPDYIRNSDIGLVLSDPVRYQKWAKGMRSDKESKALTDGIRIHTYLLEPKKFQEQYTVLAPDHNGRTKEGKAIVANIESEGKIAIKDEDMVFLETLKKTIEQHAIANDMLTHKGRHVEGIIEFEFEGQKCACKPDVWFEDERGVVHIIDLKSTKDARFVKFRNSLVDFDYWRQKYFYSQGVKAFLKRDAKIRYFIVAVEKTAYLDRVGMNVFHLSDETDRNKRAELRVKQGIELIRKIRAKEKMSIEEKNKLDYSPLIYKVD